MDKTEYDRAKPRILTGSITERATTARLLPIDQSQESRELVALLLADPSPIVRESLAAAVAERQHWGSVPADFIKEALNTLGRDPDGNVRCTVASRCDIWAWADKPLVTRLAADTQARVRCAVARNARAWFHGQEHTFHLLLNDFEENVRARCAENIGLIAENKPEIVAELARTGDPEIVEALFHSFRDWASPKTLPGLVLLHENLRYCKLLREYAQTRIENFLAAPVWTRQTLDSKDHALRRALLTHEAEFICDKGPSASNDRWLTDKDPGVRTAFARFAAKHLTNDLAAIGRICDDKDDGVRAEFLRVAKKYKFQEDCQRRIDRLRAERPDLAKMPLPVPEALRSHDHWDEEGETDGLRPVVGKSSLSVAKFEAIHVLAEGWNRRGAIAADLLEQSDNPETLAFAELMVEKLAEETRDACVHLASQKETLDGALAAFWATYRVTGCGYDAPASETCANALVEACERPECAAMAGEIARDISSTGYFHPQGTRAVFAAIRNHRRLDGIGQGNLINAIVGSADNLGEFDADGIPRDQLTATRKAAEELFSSVSSLNQDACDNILKDLKTFERNAPATVRP